jgi:hypothetical protein
MYKLLIEQVSTVLSSNSDRAKPTQIIERIGLFTVLSRAFCLDLAQVNFYQTCSEVKANF